MQILLHRYFTHLKPDNGFYNIGVHPQVDNVLIMTLTDEQGRVGIPADRWAMDVYTDKLSAIITSADKYGVYFSHYSIRRINNGEEGSFSLYATWEDLGIHPSAVTKDILKKYRSYFRDYIYQKFFKHILSLGSRPRRTILHWLHDSQDDNDGTAMWRIDTRYKLIREGGLYNVYLCDKHRMISSIEIERLTLNMFQ